MTDLTGKFNTLEEQLAAQHVEIMEALNAISVGIGVPPTTPTTTLDDIATLITSTNANLATMIADNSAFYAALLGATELINSSLDIMINNSSTNAQHILNVLNQLICPCPSEAPLLAPPLSVTPIDIEDSDKCRRIQYYLALFGSWIDKIANYGGAGATITGSALAGLLGTAVAEAGLVGGEIGAAAGPPGVILGALVGVIIAAVYTLGASILLDIATQWHNPTLQHELLVAMFLANSADEGNSAFHTAIGASDLPTVAAEIIYAMFWNGWANDIYNTVPVVDDSAFDGSICGDDTSDCIDLDSVHMVLSSGPSGQGISYAIPGATLSATTNTSSGSVTSTPAGFVAGDYAGWTIEAVSGNVRVIYRTEGLSSTQLFDVEAIMEGGTWTFPTTGTVGIDNAFVNDVQISIRLCPPVG